MSGIIKNSDTRRMHELVFQMLMMLAKGMSVQLESGVDYDSMMKEFRNILDMLKHNFYKEEYLP